MKKFLSTVLAACLLCTSIPGVCNAEMETIIKEASGFGGTVTAEVTFDGDKITALTFAGANETPSIGGAALEALTEKILAANSADVDGITGATFTSNAALSAVKEAIAQHRGETVTYEIPDVTGTFTSSAAGYAGSVSVAVTLDHGVITDVNIGENKETYGIGQYAIAWLPERIVENQNIAADAITGATVTSNAIKAALESAMTEAGINTTAYKKTTTYERQSENAIEMTTDIVVVGAGMGGMASAISALDEGKRVVLLERLDFVGGESAMTGGMFTVSGTKFQKSQGVEDSPEMMTEAIIAEGHGQQLDRLTKVFTEQMGAIFDEMSEEVGWEPNNISGVRCWTVDGGRGSYITEPMKEYLVANNADIMLHTEGYELVTDGDNTVTGIKARDTKSGQEYIIHAGAVILATGGFSQDTELKAEYGITGLFAAPLQISSGMGHRMALALNAGTYRMDMVCNRPGGMIGDDGLAYNCNNGLSAIRNSTEVSYVAVNAEGNRYAAEFLEGESGMMVSDPNAVSTKSVDSIGGTAYIVMDQKAFDLWREKSPSIPAQLIDGWLESNGTGLARLTHGTTVREAAEAMGLNPDNAEHAVATYNKYAKEGSDPDFHCVNMAALSEEGPYYILGNQNRYNSHMGGLLASDNMEIMLNDETNVIKGLYGAGSIIGGHQGDIYIAGGMIAWGMTSGELAGRSAAAYINAQ